MQLLDKEWSGKRVFFGFSEGIEKKKKKTVSPTISWPPLPRHQRLLPRRLFALVDRVVAPDDDDGLADLVLAQSRSHGA